jgi:hypothetical protein
MHVHDQFVLMSHDVGLKRRTYFFGNGNKKNDALEQERITRKQETHLDKLNALTLEVEAN